MSEQNIAFEKWKLSAKLKVKQPLIYETNLIKEAFNAGYKAATAEANKMIAELESEVAELKTTVRSDNSKVIAALNAHINDLCEALEDISNWTFGWDGDCGVTAVALQALSKTPAQSLQAHDDEVIEKCAKVCDEDEKQSREFAEPFAARCAELLAEAIRALKGK